MKFAMVMSRLALALVGMCIALPSIAQVRGDQSTAVPTSLSSTAEVKTGQTAQTGSGSVGQRQTRQDAVPNVTPLDRIQNRVASRVQNRIRNRIDRYYDPQATATSPFEVASDRARNVKRPSPR